MNKRKIIAYSLTKYFELGAMALVLLHFAKESGPEIYGSLSLFLVMISYSAFAVLGINAVYVKQYSISFDEVFRCKLTVFNFWYNFLLGILVFLVISFFLIDDHLVAAVICFFNILRGGVQSILRAELRVYQLACFNLFFSIGYIFFYYHMVVAVSAYEIDVFLRGWAFSLFFAICLGCVLVFHVISTFANYSLSFVKDNFPLLIKGAILLFLINFGNTIFLSLDRVLLNTSSVSLEFIGYYQFADNLSSMFHMGTNALLFLMVPIYLKGLSNGSISPQQFKVKFLSFFSFWLLPFFVFLYFSIYIVELFFEQYKSAVPLLVYLSVSKFLCLILFIPTTLLTALNKEVKVIVYYSITIAIMCAFQVVWIRFFTEYLELLPLISSLCIFVMLVFLVNEKVDSKPI